MEITNTFPDYLSELENKIVFFDNDLLVFDNLKDFNVKGKIEVEVYVLTLCTKGHGTLAVNEKKCELKSNDIFICRPSHILETLMMSVDFECLCICMTREFLQDILMRSNSSWNMKVYIEDNPVLHIDEEDAELIIQYAQLIKATMAQNNKHYYKEIVTSLLCAMSFDFSNILEKKIFGRKAHVLHIRKPVQRLFRPANFDRRAPPACGILRRETKRNLEIPVGYMQESERKDSA